MYNVLLITSDQHRWDCLGAHNETLKTPNLDQLSREGILFDRAYTSNPVCTPARVSMLTGHYPSTHGCYTIGTSLPQDYPTVPGAMHEKGCYTGLIGKAHFQQCTNQPNHTDIKSIEAPPYNGDLDYFRRWDGPYFGFEHVQLSIDHGNSGNTPSMHYGAWLKDLGVDIEAYFGTGEYSDWGKWELPEEYHYSKWVADKTIEAFDEKGDKPFFIWSSFQDPHNPCVVPDPWYSMYNPKDMPDFTLTDGEFEDKPSFYENSYLLEKNGVMGDPELDTKEGWYCFRGLERMTPDATRELAACYFGMISLMDHHIGRIIESLKKKGLYENTIIIFTSDHGDYLGNHGLWWKGLPAYEDIQKVPFIVRHPQCQTPGMRSQALQSTLDIPQTALAAMGLNEIPGLQGVNQLNSWQDGEAVVRDWALCEYRPTRSPFMQKTFIYDKWKFVLYHNRDYGELYDLEKDPNQMVNLWTDSEYEKRKLKLYRKFIDAEMEKDGVLRARPCWA